MKKFVSSFLSVALLATLLASCGGAATGEATKPAEGTAPESKAEAAAPAAGGDAKISILNTKSEIQTQWEEFATAYEEATGVEVEVSVTVGDSPSEDITKRYASGEVPTIFMGDVQDVIMLDEYALDLSAEKWVADGGEQYGAKVGERIISFPFCIEARGLMYNKTAIEEKSGDKFDPEAVNTTEELKAVLDKLVAGGMETPVALNKEDWSLAGHYLTQMYEEQDATAAGAQKFIDELKAGAADVMKNARFTSLFDTFDLLMQYNVNKADPLAADYNANAVALSEGDVGFWFNGNWAWAEMADYAVEGSEYGIMPVPQNDNTNQVTDKLAGSASKHCMIDTKHNSEAQQTAAKELLNYLVYEDAGQDFLVNKSNLVPAFKNIALEVTNPMGKSVQGYTAAGNLVEGYPTYPGDHWKTVGAEMQKYLGGQSKREELATNIQSYWTSQK